jgi:hypothetical protein
MPIAAITHLSSNLVRGVAIGVSLACVPLFLLMLADRETRLAVSSFNRDYRRLSWRQKIISDVYGDRWLLIFNRLIWLELVIRVLLGQDDALAGLAFAGFFITTLMLILMLMRYASRLEEAVSAPTA